jgi:hypothetical protein
LLQRLVGQVDYYGEGGTRSRLTVLCRGVCAGWVWRIFVGTNVWFVGRSVRRLQGPLCGWCLWAGACELLELHWEFCGFGLDDMG